MRGDLSDTPAADACRDLAGDGVTGVLSIDGPDGSGSVSFVEGRIVGATSPIPRARLGDRLVGAGFLEDEALSDALEAQRGSGGHSRLGAVLVERALVPHDAIRLFVQEQTLDALFEVLRWRFGSFCFESGKAAAVPEVPVAMTVDQALGEVARRQQQWRELSRVIPDLEAVPTFGSDPASAAASLKPDEFAVLESIDGDRSVRTLAVDLGYGESDLARIVYGLVLLGVVEIELPQDEIGAALDDAVSYADHGAPDPPPDVSAPSTAAGPPAQESGGEKPEASEDAGVETDLPERTYSDVLRELRGLDVEGTAPPPNSAPEPISPSPPVPPPGTAAPAAAEPQEAPRRPGEDEDVSEFLRALSQLALDEPQAEPERPRRSPPPPSEPEDGDGKRKRRGLFRWR